MSYLKIENLSFDYGSINLIKEFSLELAVGEIHCLLGPSGCGKSTLLNLMAGFLRPRQGKISIDDVVLVKDHFFSPPEKRQVGVVFQEHCLFPHLTVAENIKFGFRGGEKQNYLKELLSLIQLTHKAKSFPEELSGGEQQRVAIARALANRPKVLLMDEPFSGLDQDLRIKLRREIKKILKSVNLTALIVTHSQDEAVEMGDRLTVLDETGAYQSGNIQELLERPNSVNVVRFLHSGFFIKGLFNGLEQRALTHNGALAVAPLANFKDREDLKVFIPYTALRPALGPPFLQATIINRYPGKWRTTYELTAENIIGDSMLMDNIQIGGEFDLGESIGFDLKSQNNWIAFS